MSTFSTQSAYRDPFAVYIDDAPPGAAAGQGAAKGLDYSNRRPVRLQRWNTGFRLSTFGFTLAAAFAIFFAREQGKNGWKAEYKYFSTFQFLLYTNIVVCLYALVIFILAIVMGRKGTGQSTPNAMTTKFLALNMTACSLLLLAFAAATATETISRNGWKFHANEGSASASSWRLCDDYSTFCAIVELGLGLTGIAFVTLAASTAIDAHYNHNLRNS